MKEGNVSGIAEPGWNSILEPRRLKGIESESSAGWW